MRARALIFLLSNYFFLFLDSNVPRWSGEFSLPFTSGLTNKAAFCVLCFLKTI